MLQPLDRLAVFVSELGTGLPLARLPVAAEVVFQGADLAAVPPPDSRAEVLTARVLSQLDVARPRETARTVVTQLYLQLDHEVLDDLVITATAEFERLVETVVQHLRDDHGAPPWSAGEVAAAVQRAIGDLGLDPVEPRSVQHWSYALGVLATDHVGFLSFDLTSLPGQARDAVTEALDTRVATPDRPRLATVLLHPMGSLQPIDAIAQGRTGPRSLVARLELPRPAALAGMPGLGMPAMQAPSLADWRLSPGSFAHDPATLVGQECCESLLPSDVAVSERHLVQVVRLTDVADLPATTTQQQVVLGVANDYRVAWYPLGHSLGQVLYSLPLAPGESVNLAVVDWTRRDDAQRKELTGLDEQLVHDEHRDRAITETVEAAVREYQHGSSFLGGIAGAVSGSSGAVSGGAVGSLGGATSASSGVRSVSAETVQQVADHIHQESSARRELRSTVVVHSTQAEREAIETRTVVNYNHSHAMTILYHEVLKQFRVVTELHRRRPVVLVQVDTGLFSGADAASHARTGRQLLQPALLDPSFAGGFAALDRIERRRLQGVAAAVGTPATPPQGPGARQFAYLTLDMKTGGLFNQPWDDHGHQTDVLASLVRDPLPWLELTNGDGSTRLSHFGSFRQPDAVNTFTAVVPAGTRWDSIRAVRFFINPQGDSDQAISFSRITLTAIDTDGVPEVLADVDYGGGHLIITDEGAHVLIPTRRPPVAGPPAPRAADELADDVESQALLDHLAAHDGWYSRVLALGADAAARVDTLAGITLADSSTLLEKVDPRPLEMVGDRVAYPVTDPAWIRLVERSLDDDPAVDPVLDERLVALPTRGVFAEAKLAACNASERIDNTRFWDWQTSPVPHLAPEIAPVTPVTPQPTTPDLTPTAFPASLENIDNPPAAPDPTGLAGALGLLATSNIFRDMSGRAEVAGLLQSLAADATSLAGGSGSGSGGAAGRGSTGGTTTSSGSSAVGGRRATPAQPSAVNRDLHDLQGVLGQAQASGLITPDQAQQAYGSALTSAVDPDLQTVGGRYTPPAVTPNQLIGLVGEQNLVDALRAQGLVVFTDWSKSVAANGFDMVALDRKGGTVWLIDNKAQLRGVSSAPSLTGPQFDANLASARDFLAKTHPDAAAAAEAVALIDAKKTTKVVGNAWSGNRTTFTKSLIESGVAVYDVRLRGLFTDHQVWKDAFVKLPKLPGRLGLRGTAVFEGGFLVLAVASGSLWVMRNEQQVATVLGELAAETALGAVLDLLPGGFFAGMVLGLESDNSYLLAARKRAETIETISAGVPGFAAMTPGDQAEVRRVVGTLVDDPLPVVVPEPERPKQILPWFTWPWEPSIQA